MAMSNSTVSEQSSAQELYFLYELAKVFSSSLELNEVAEYILDGTCALVGTEQGFLCSLEAPAEGQLPVLTPYILRGISSSTLLSLTPRLQPTWANRQSVNLSQPGAGSNDWKDLLAAPLIVRDQVHGVLGISTATARAFTPREQQRLVSVANLAALALENARLHDQIQREVQVLRRLIHAAQQVGQGQRTAEQITELENSAGWGEISQLSRVFAQMARQVIEREEALHQKVRELEIVIDAAKRNQQISEITETDYFQRIQEKVQELREKRRR
jgi:transcriptional regulator with GAF, ATPase, and Fis domain